MPEPVGAQGDSCAVVPACVADVRLRRPRVLLRAGRVAVPVLDVPVAVVPLVLAPVLVAPVVLLPIVFPLVPLVVPGDV